MIRTSVIIPAYNSVATIGKAIDSAINQESDCQEIIVVNDGSTDSTLDVLESYKGSIKVVRQGNAGAAAARNAGVATAQGEYLAFLDADDEWLPGRLERTLSALERNPAAVMAFGDYVPVDESGKLLKRGCAGRPPSHQDLLDRAWPILPSAATVRRWAFERAGGFCEEFKGCGGDDPYMWLMLSEYGPFEYVPEPLMIYCCGSPADVVEKYEPGRRTFERLVKARYGKAAKGLLRGSRQYFAGMALTAALEEFDRGNRARAAGLLARVVYYRPFLLLHPNLLARLLNPRNFERVVRSLRPFEG